MGGWPDDCRCAEQPSGADDEHNLLLNPLLSNALVNAVIMIQDVEGPRDGEEDVSILRSGNCLGSCSTLLLLPDQERGPFH